MDFQGLPFPPHGLAGGDPVLGNIHGIVAVYLPEFQRIVSGRPVALLLNLMQRYAELAIQ
jgi:hypothetical protein